MNYFVKNFWLPLMSDETGDGCIHCTDSKIFGLL